MFVELQSSHRFMVNISLVMVKLTVQAPSRICVHVFKWRRDLHLYGPRRVLVACKRKLHKKAN